MAPCGTITAYQRHKRRGEPVDDACAQACRDQKNRRVGAKQAAVAEAVRLRIADEVPPAGEGPLERIDELAEARENLQMVKAAMRTGVPTGLAALSKQYADLVVLVKRLEAEKAPEVSALDQLAQRRAERLAKTAN